MEQGETRPGGLPSARGAALDLLTHVTGERRTLAEVEDAVLAPLDTAERARARRLATGTLRWAGRTDRFLGPYLRRKPPEFVLNILRLAVTEMAVDGAAPHGVVASAVTAARVRSGHEGLARLVNAVLRRAAADLARWHDLPLPTLPKPLRRRLVGIYGKSRVAAMEAVFAAAPPVDLTARGDAEALARDVGGGLLPTGSVRIAAGVRISALPGYESGAFWVQDAAAALPVRLLGPQPGERIVDLCAAPGGKTLQLAAAGSAVSAVDQDAARLDRVRENLARTGLGAELVRADARRFDPPGALFDAVLVDAPCSATGTIRRHPDLPFARPDPDIGPLLALQRALLDRAARLLRPGGRFVFCTCSLLPEEGELQAAAFLVRNPGWRLAPVPDVDWIDAAWRSADGGLRITPESWAGQGGIDGFYIARFEKPGGSEPGDDSGPAAR